jgi:hypothetical protein
VIARKSSPYPADTKYTGSLAHPFGPTTCH